MSSINVKFALNKKLTRQLFLSVERNTNLFDFVHSDIYELNGMLTRGCNRTFLEMINAMLLHAKIFI